MVRIGLAAKLDFKGYLLLWHRAWAFGSSLRQTSSIESQQPPSSIQVSTGPRYIKIRYVNAATKIRLQPMANFQPVLIIKI